MQIATISLGAIHGEADEFIGIGGDVNIPTALWKFKLDQVDEDNPIPRKNCRIDVLGPVKDIILQYLTSQIAAGYSDNKRRTAYSHTTADMMVISSIHITR